MKNTVEYEGLQYNNDYTICFGPKKKTIKSAVLHQNTRVIFKSSFEDCKNLTNIVLNDKLTHISSYAFCHCENLESVEFPDSLERMDESAFAFTSLKIIDLENTKIKELYIPDSLTELKTTKLISNSNDTKIYYSGINEDVVNILNSNFLKKRRVR